MYITFSTLVYNIIKINKKVVVASIGVIDRLVHYKNNKLL